ncbi:MAG: succinylglutamate desuccinylase [Armatimonadota bacterium]|nr:succinylglutamate desuccinylase [Armatimonadota bacterium]
MRPHPNVWASAVACAAVAIVVGLTAGEFRAQFRPDPIVPGPGVTKVVRLSDYFAGIRGRAVDTDVYFLEGRGPGGTVLVLGGTHPPEPAGMLAAVVLVENARVQRGRLLVIPQANRSGFTATPAGLGFPGGFTVQTPRGPLRFRIGGKNTNPIHQWPDPDEYVNPATGARWSGEQARDLNRVYPGRPSGYLTERLAYALMELIRRERVALVLDMHEAPPDRPLINAMAVHPRGVDVATVALLNLELQGIKVRLEISPAQFRGLSHREIPEYSQAVAMLHETNSPLHGALRGRATEELLTTARDEFLVHASRAGWTGTTHPPEGVPLDVRVARHVAMAVELTRALTEVRPSQAVVLEGVPSYNELAERGVGQFLQVPDQMGR